MAIEQTLSIIKPDAVQKKAIGAIISRFENNGLTVKNLWKGLLTTAQAQAFYAVHAERPFYNDLVAFMTSGPVVVMVLEGDDAINANRRLMGATNPAEAAEGTIRRDFADSIEANAVHGSDSPNSASREVAYFFSDEEICDR